MKHQIIWLLLLPACNAPQSSPPVLPSPTAAALAQASRPQLVLSPDATERDAASPQPSGLEQSELAQAVNSADSSLTADSVTLRADIRSLDTSRLIADCPADSSPYAFAESARYQVQICSQEYDPWLPKYYIGQAKADGSSLRITNTNLDEARQLIFRNAGYTYILDRSSARPQQSNAYLQIYAPNGDQSTEALLSLYEIGPPR